MSDSARRAAERAARDSYGKLLAILAAHSRDIAASEDALADAFAAALSTWPHAGVPSKPEAWLLTSARNALLNTHRHQHVREAAVAHLEHAATLQQSDGNAFADERLKLLFVCAHPAIDVAVRTPLMLQTVLGLDAARIASAFLVAPATMGQRLVRAKSKIRDAGLRFEMPEPDHLAERLGDVLDAIYAAFGTGWDAIAGADADLQGLTDESIYLGRLVVALMPSEPEAKGLLALMLFCESRRQARRDADGRFVPLRGQNAAAWSWEMVGEADRLLTDAARAARFGRYQCEAAIQSLHAQRAATGNEHFEELAILYELLAAHHPTVGVLVAQASVRLESGDARGALAALDAIDTDTAASYQPYWVTRASCFGALGDAVSHRAALDIAIGLTQDPSVRAFLSRQRDVAFSGR